MAGYSGTPLPQKLGIKPGMTVVIINAPTNYRRLLGTIPEGVTFADRLKADSDFVHVFIKKRRELEQRLYVLREKIADTGTVWASWPKRYLASFGLTGCTHSACLLHEKMFASKYEISSNSR